MKRAGGDPLPADSARRGDWRAEKSDSVHRSGARFGFLVSQKPININQDAV
jgi:hypothetical protein